MKGFGSTQGNLAAKERKERKEQPLYFYAFSAFFRGQTDRSAFDFSGPAETDTLNITAY
jgi:hypothetical protein